MKFSLQKIAHRCLAVIGSVASLLLFFWSVGALWYLPKTGAWIGPIIASLYATVAAWHLIHHGPARWRIAVLLPVLLIFMLSWAAQPRTERHWSDDNLYQSVVDVDANGNVCIQHFRRKRVAENDQTKVEYQPFRFQLSDLRRVWFVVHRFSELESIAHNFLTFEVHSAAGPRYVTVSVEVRREQGEQFSPVRGLYQQYELIYVFADELDQIGSRTVLRPNDRSWMFAVNADSSQVQALFRDIAKRANRLAVEPEFYHSLTNNCTNNLVVHTYGLTPSQLDWLDPRVVLPGLADRLAFARQLIGSDGQSFEDLQRQSRIDKVARRHGLNAGFSEALRSQTGR